MKRNTFNFLIDILSALMMFGMIDTGLLIRFVLPPGSGSRRILWGYGRHDWGDVHFWLAVGVAVTLVVHVALHWQWVCVTAMRMVRGAAGNQLKMTPIRRNIAGVALVLLLAGSFGAFVWVASANVTDTRGPGSTIDSEDREVDSHGLGGGNASQTEAGVGNGGIQGFMSLADIAKALSTDVPTVRRRLNLPNDVSADERLGRLSKQYKFSVSDARAKLMGDATTEKR
ncbi:hypothetical protein BH10PLA1_BH10PLA1_07270 [soil metagenome]